MAELPTIELTQEEWLQLSSIISSAEYNAVSEDLPASEPSDQGPNYSVPVGEPVGSAQPHLGQVENKPVEKSSRFGTVNKENVDVFISDQDNENTKRKTEGDLRLFRLFCEEQGETRPIETLSINDLDALFGNFIAVVKKKDGEDYEPSTIRGYVSSLDRYLRSKGYTQIVNKNPLFPHSNNALKAKMTFLKSEGKGCRPNEAEELTDQDIDALFRCQQLGQDNGTQITNLLHTTFSLVMGIRGGREQHTLKWGDIVLRTDEDGDEFLEHSRERQTKTRTGRDASNIRKFKPKAWNNKQEPERCPVNAYKKFREQRPAAMMHDDAPFFLSINYTRNPQPNTKWFKNTAMGINTIYGLTRKMRENCDEINTGRKITNHSTRKHLMQKCNDIGIPANLAIQISGHKNIGSANNYSKLNQNQQKIISSALTNTSLANDRRIVPQNHPNAMPLTTNTSEIQNAQSAQSVSYSQQASSSKSEFQSVFHGTTVIHGGTFNFYTADKRESSQSMPSPTAPKKLKRILPIIESDSDE